jgi:hypothetical protein
MIPDNLEIVKNNQLIIVELDKEIEELCKSLNNKKVQLKVDTQNRLQLIYDDPNVHILDKYLMWADLSEKTTEPYIIKSNLVRNEVYDGFDSFERRQTIDVLDEVAYYMDEEFDIYIDETVEESVYKGIYESLDDENKDMLTKVLEAVIKENVGIFKVDW